MPNPLLRDRDIDFLLYEIHDTEALCRLSAFSDRINIALAQPSGTKLDFRGVHGAAYCGIRRLAGRAFRDR